MKRLVALNLLESIDAPMAAWLAELGQRRTYSDGEFIHFRGDRDPGMAIVVSGQVRMVRRRADGRYGFVGLLQPGQHFADVLMFTARKRRTHDALAVGNVAIDHYGPAAFEQMLKRPELVRVLYAITSARLVGAMSMIDDLRTLAPEVHLAKVLLSMRSRDGINAVDCVQEDLAALLGVSGMTLAKALAILKREGLVETGYRSVVIVDPDGLRRWLAERDPE